MEYKTEYKEDMNQYEGAKNNRIDRFEGEGNHFRVSGVPNHIQDTTVYVKDDIMFLRTLRENVQIDVYNQPFTALDALSSMYRFPSPDSVFVCSTPRRVFCSKSEVFTRVG